MPGNTVLSARQDTLKKRFALTYVACVLKWALPQGIHSSHRQPTSLLGEGRHTPRQPPTSHSSIHDCTKLHLMEKTSDGDLQS